tara:strand:+ start:255 stop:527 length:273 start_codon:yes stop_codon:yes gene_type:complete
MPRTSFGKTRPQEKPYAIYKNNSGWEWRVLKTYKHSDAERKDPYARWFVAATSPMMHDGQFEMGDTYARDIMNNGHLVLADDTWLEEYAS